MRFKKYLSLTLIICAFLVFLTSPISARDRRHDRDFDNNQLQVYIKDEGFHEKNIVKPRIYVKNVGKRPIHGFDLFYYFTVEPGKTPVVDSYYLPNGSVRIVNQGRGNYYLHFHFNGVNISPGAVFPGRDGFVVGLHYADWSKMNKNNDYSNPGSSKWQVTYRVDVKTFEAPPRRNRY